MRIKEAIMFARERGKRIQMQELATKLWPETKSLKGAHRNLNRLMSGTSKRVESWQVEVLCRETGVDANFLFEIEPMEYEKEV